MVETLFVVFKGFINVNKDEWFSVVGPEARATRMTTTVTEEGESRKENVLNVERARLETRRNFFTVRAAKKWNEIPEAVKKQTSVNAFKNCYDRWKTNRPTDLSGDIIEDFQASELAIANE